MNYEVPDAAERWTRELTATLATAAELVRRGRTAFDTDPAVPLAFEALSNRVGDLARRLVAVDPRRFSEPLWSAAARNRDVVVHHYHRLDKELLWSTVATDFPKLAALLPESSEGKPSTHP